MKIKCNDNQLNSDRNIENKWKSLNMCDFQHSGGTCITLYWKLWNLYKAHDDLLGINEHLFKINENLPKLLQIIKSINIKLISFSDMAARYNPQKQRIQNKNAGALFVRRTGEQIIINRLHAEELDLLFGDEGMGCLRFQVHPCLTKHLTYFNQARKDPNLSHDRSGICVDLYIYIYLYIHIHTVLYRCIDVCVYIYI